MPHRDPAEPHPEVLPHGDAERLLARASELDAVRQAGTPVAELRAAAAEAGISAPAFEAALAELHGARQARVPEAVPPTPRRPRRWPLAVAAAFLMLTGAVVATRMVVPAPVAVPAGAPIVEEAILLRCLPAGEAAELIRPLLRFRENAVVVAAHAPRVLTVRATAAQLQEVRSLLDRYERAESPACAAGAAPSP